MSIQYFPDDTDDTDEEFTTWDDGVQDALNYDGYDLTKTDDDEYRDGYSTGMGINLRVQGGEASNGERGWW